MLLIIISIFIVGLLYLVYNQLWRMRYLPPYAERALPIIGHSILALTAKNYYNVITNIIKHELERRVECFTVRLGIWDFQAIMNPDDAYIVANASLTKDSVYDLLKPFLGEGLITVGPSKWKMHRKLLNPTFNQQVLDSYLHEINNQTRQLIDTVSVEVGKGPFDHYKYLNQSILQTVCATSMGISIDEEDKHTREMFIKALQDFFAGIIERVFKFWLHSDIIFKLTGRKKDLDMQTDKMNLLSQAILEKKKAEFLLRKKQTVDTTETSVKPFKSFTEQLLELSEHGELSDREISDEVNTFIMGGTDTITITVSNALTCIGTYKAVQERIMTELLEVFEGSDRDVEKKDISRLKYLEAVVKETLRLYPVVPLIGRILDKDIKIKDYTLPAGSKCYMVIYGILRHWIWGTDAHTFRPERWLDGSLPTNMKGWAAFGIGKRNCIGGNFAMMCIKTVLASFLRKYSISSDVTQMVQEFYVVTKAISGHEISINKNKFYK